MSTVSENNTPKSATDSLIQEIAVNAYLAEFQTLRSEIVSLEQGIHSLSMYALISMGGIATLVVSLISNQQVELLLSVLLFLPLPFTAMLFSFVGYLNAITNISLYIANHVEPNVNSIIKSSFPSVSDVLHWETYQRTELKGKIGWLTAGFWAGEQAALIFLPIVASLAAWFFTVSQFHQAVESWWIILLAFDFVLLIVAFLSAAVVVLRFGLLGKEKQAG